MIPMETKEEQIKYFMDWFNISRKEAISEIERWTQETDVGDTGTETLPNRKDVLLRNDSSDTN